MTSNTYQGDVLAEETHRGRLVGLLALAAMLGTFAAFAVAPTRAPFFPVILVAVVGFFGIAMAWSGFQYRFRHDAVEIRMLGFSLRTIPAGDILSYSVEPWNLIRGYGIRGIGRTRAYVWCNRVVHIKTPSGDVYLGHENPERIVRDLDMVTGFVKRG